MNNIKIIAMDFDGTLLTSDKKISDRTKNCLINLKNRSYKIIGVTARNLISVKNVLDINLFNYIILNNGSDIYYVEEDRIENISNIKSDIAKDIYDYCIDKSYQIDFCTPYKYLIKSDKKGDNRPVIRYINSFNDIDDSISRMNIFFKDKNELEENKKLIENKFGNNIDIIKMLDTDKENSRIWLTINPKNINKLNTLKNICNSINCSMDEVIFFGDGENDLVLIENAGIGVAMDNALNIVKEKANYITLSNDNDGIAEYIENNF